LLRNRRTLDLRLLVWISRLQLRFGQVVGFVTFHYVKCRAALKNGTIKRVRKLQIRLYTIKSFNLMNSLIFWVPRNAKALKGPILAGEGIGLLVP
jgi:hypothetical protein